MLRPRAGKQSYILFCAPEKAWHSCWRHQAPIPPTPLTAQESLSLSLGLWEPQVADLSDGDITLLS